MECLVTKLKGVVNDDSLNKLGVLHLFQPYYEEANVDTMYMKIITGNSPVTVTVDGTINSTQSSITIPALSSSGFTVNNKKGGTNIWVENIYDVKLLQLGRQYFYSQRELDALFYSKNCKGISFNVTIPEAPDYTVDVKNMMNLLYFVPRNISITNIREILKNKALVYVEYSSGLKIEDFQNFENIQHLGQMGGDFSKLPKSIREYNQSNASVYSGSIEELVANQRTAGRTTGAIKVIWLKTLQQVTFEGKVMANWWSDKGYSKNDGFISWDDSTITVGEEQPASYVAIDSQETIILGI